MNIQIQENKHSKSNSCVQIPTQTSFFRSTSKKTLYLFSNSLLNRASPKNISKNNNQLNLQNNSQTERRLSKFNHEMLQLNSQLFGGKIKHRTTFGSGLFSIDYPLEEEHQNQNDKRRIIRQLFNKNEFVDLEDKFNHFTVLVDILQENLKNKLENQTSLPLSKKLKEIEVQSYNMLSNLLDLYKKLQGDVENLKNQVIKLDDQKLKIMKEHKKAIEFQKEEKNKGTQFDLKPLEEKIQCLTLENLKLKSQIQSLARKLEIVQTDNDIIKLKEDYQKVKNTLTQKNTQLEETVSLQEQQILGLQVLVNNTKNANKELDQKNKEYRQQYETFQKEKKKISNEKQRWVDLIQNYRERMNMQYEDYQSLKIRLQQNQDTLKQTQVKMSNMQSKMDKTQLQQVNLQLHQDFKLVQYEIPPNPFYKDEINAFTAIKPIYQNNNTFYKYIRGSYKGFKPDEIEKKQLALLHQGQKEPQANSDDEQQSTFDLSKYHYVKPTYFTYIEAQFVSKTRGSADYFKHSQLSPAFLPTLRFLLDSFYTHIQFNSLTFIPFAYMWLGYYKFDTNLRELQMFHSENDENRVWFYLELSANKAGRLWEIITMREFLLDRSPTEEVIFYLHCRYLLFKGKQSNKQTSSYDIIHYVQWYHAERVLEIVLNKFEEKTLELINLQIKKFIIRKNNKEFIDSALFLKFLLEFYRTERQFRLRIYRDLFLSFPYVEKKGFIGLTFDGFKKMFQSNFRSFSKMEIIQLYSECFNAGGGLATADAFYAVTSENPLFYKKTNNLGYWLQTGTKLQLENPQNFEKEIIDKYEQKYNEMQANKLLLDYKRFNILDSEKIRIQLNQFTKSYGSSGQVIHLEFLKNIESSLSYNDFKYLKQLSYAYSRQEWIDLCSLQSYFIFIQDSLTQMVQDVFNKDQDDPKFLYDIRKVKIVQRKVKAMIKKFYNMLEVQMDYSEFQKQS